MQEIRLYAADFLNLSQINHKRRILAFPADPAFHKTSSSEQTVSQSRLSKRSICTSRLIKENHGSTLSKAFLLTRHIPASEKLAVLNRRIASLIQGRHLKTLYLALKIIQLGCKLLHIHILF